MKSFEYTCKATLGLHARPAAILAVQCTALKSAVTISANGKTASGNNVLDLIALRAGKGTPLTITVEADSPETEERDLQHLKEVFADIIPTDNNLDILKVAFYGTKDYDRIFFSELAKDIGDGAYNAELTYFSSRLTIESVHLSQGFDAVCIFVNDEAPREVIEQLAANGVRLILMRCAGYNNVDLAAAKEYGMTVLAWDINPDPKLEEAGLVTYVSKEELLERADLISVNVPLFYGEGGTYHLIDADAIARMKDDAMFVNASRGALVDAEALIAALKTGKFHAVALDVYEGEDANVYTDHSDDVLTNDITARLTSFPQVVLTSHQAFFTRDALQAIAAETMENARNFLQGMPYGKAEVLKA